MKAVLCIILSVTVYAVIASDHKDTAEGKYSRFIQYPDNNGVLRWIDLEAQPKLFEKIERNPANNVYQLFTRNNPTTPQELTWNATSILLSNFDPNLVTVVSVHGWWGQWNVDSNIVLKDAFLNRSAFNVIIVDWNELAAQDYVVAVAGVPVVGTGLGQFLNFLGSVTGITLGSIHLVGFSLGAHVVGNAGKQLNGRIARITGLDPAGPLWDLNPNRLHFTDAIYVEAIHTDASLGIGSLLTVGDVDFYVNGGDAQPGCDTSQCNHDRSWELLAASVSYSHLFGRRCLGVTELQTDTCSGEVLNLGDIELSKEVYPGIYRVNTGSEYPF